MIGLGAACKIASEEMDYDKQHITRLAKRLYDGITSQVNGRKRPRSCVSLHCKLGTSRGKKSRRRKGIYGGNRMWVSPFLELDRK